MIECHLILAHSSVTRNINFWNIKICEKREKENNWIDVCVTIGLVNVSDIFVLMVHKWSPVLYIHFKSCMNKDIFSHLLDKIGSLMCFSKITKVSCEKLDSWLSYYFRFYVRLPIDLHTTLSLCKLLCYEILSVEWNFLFINYSDGLWETW